MYVRVERAFGLIVLLSAVAAAGGEVPADGTSSAKAGGEPPASVAPPEGEVSVPKEDAAQTPADQGDSGPSDAAEGAAEVDAESRLEASSRAAAAAEPASGSGERKLKFSFRYQPWSEVLDWFAEEAGLSLAMDVTPSGTFNYVDDRSYTPGEALDVLNSILLTKGYTLVRRDKMLFIIDLEDELDATLVRDLLVEVPLKDLDKRGDFEVSKVRFTLKGIAPEEAEKQINKLLSPLGSIVVMPKAGQLVVTETGGTLRTIREILDSLDEAVAEKSLQTFRLKRANADQVVAAIKPLVGIPQDAGAAEDGSIRISIDAVGNTVFATGKPDKIAIVKQVIEQIDSSDDQMNGGGGVTEATQFMTHPVTTADPAAVLRVLQTILGDQPDVRLEIEPGTGNMIALATPGQHRTIDATIAEIEQHPEQFAVIPLYSLDPAAAALLINKMFDTGEEGSGKGPTVDGTLNPQQLVVRGSQAQIEQIQELLKSLGETNDSRGPVALGRGNIRLLQIDSDTAQAALQRIERVWSTMGHRNPIRVLTPPTAISRMPLERHEAGPSQLNGGPGAIRGGGRRRGPAGDSPVGPRPRRGGAPGGRGRDRSEPPKPAAGGPPPKTAELDHVRFRLIAAVEDAPEPGSNSVESAAQGPASADAPAGVRAGEPRQDSDTDSIPGGSPARGDGPEIIVSVEPGGLVISSSDIEALDAFEALLDAFSRQNGSGAARFHLFYLKHVEAEAAKTLVESILAGVGSSTFASSDAVRSALSSLGGGLLGSSLGGSSPALIGSGVRINADTRLNALFVHGSPGEVRMVKELLDVIDEESGPEEVLTFPKPKFIPVYYTSAEEVATILRQLYADRIVTERSRAQSSSSSGRDSMMEAMRSRFGGRGGSSDRGRSSRNEKKTEGPKMSLGVDATSNSIIVSAPGPLLKEVEAVIEELDQRAGTQDDQDVVIVTLKRANPKLVEESLKGFFGDDVRTSGNTSGSSTRGGRGGTSGRGGTPPGRSGDDMRRRMEFMDAMRRRMTGGDRGGSGRGGSGRGGSGGGRPSRGR
jgi:type II secretory pathway component GspD/PulD (secretin)